MNKSYGVKMSINTESHSFNFYRLKSEKNKITKDQIVACLRSSEKFKQKYAKYTLDVYEDGNFLHRVITQKIQISEPLTVKDLILRKSKQCLSDQYGMFGNKESMAHDMREAGYCVASSDIERVDTGYILETEILGEIEEDPNDKIVEQNKTLKN